MMNDNVKDNSLLRHLQSEPQTIGTNPVNEDGDGGFIGIGEFAMQEIKRQQLTSTSTSAILWSSLKYTRNLTAKLKLQL